MRWYAIAIARRSGYRFGVCVGRGHGSTMRAVAYVLVCVYVCLFVLMCWCCSCAHMWYSHVKAAKRFRERGCWLAQCIGFWLWLVWFGYLGGYI